MILDRLENAHRYKGMHPVVDQALDYIQTTDFTEMALGRHKINPQLDAIVDEYETVAAETSQYEAHKKYIDVQLILAGEEYMGVVPLTYQTPSKAYDAEQDFALYQVAGQMIQVKTNMFVIFFPTDLHMPSIGTPPRKIRKVVMKAQINPDGSI